jgi:type II secretory pathway pseudopilin PulG
MKRAGDRISSAFGFTLVEVLAALLFLAVSIPAILGALSISSRAAEIAERTSLAGQLAENELGELIVAQSGTGRMAETRGEFTDNPGYRWEATQETGALSPSDMLTIRVFFQVQGKERSVALSTLLSSTSSTTY